jgi:Flp pilus assembly protein TadG
MNGVLRKRTIRRVLARLRDERGANLVEFALSLMMLITIMLGIMGFAIAMYSYHFVTYAAQEGARYAIVRGHAWAGSGACQPSTPTNFTIKYGCVAQQADVENYVKSIATPMIDQTKIVVTTTWPGTTPNCSKNCAVACPDLNDQGCMVQVNVSYSFNSFMPLLPKNTLTFAGASKKVIQE